MPEPRKGDTRHGKASGGAGDTRHDHARELPRQTNPTDPRLLLVIARNEESFDGVVTSLLDIGVVGATVVEARGLAAILREEMPIFAGLAALLPQTTGARILFSITTFQHVAQLIAHVSKFPKERQPILLSIPVDQIFGVTR